MIKPYETIIRDIVPGLSMFDFRIVANGDDSIVIGDSVRSMEISTDLRNPREMTIRITDARGNDRALWVIEKILDPEGTKEKMKATRDLAGELNLDSRSLAEITQDGSFLRYVHFAMSWTFDFVKAHF